MTTRPLAEQIVISNITTMPNVTNIQQAIEHLSSRSQLTYSTELRNARMQAIVDAIGTAGRLDIGTIGMGTTLVILPLSTPMGVVSDGILTFSGMPLTGYAIASGFAVEARIVNSNNDTVISGITVGYGVGYHIQISNVEITNNQLVTVDSATIVHF